MFSRKPFAKTGTAEKTSATLAFSYDKVLQKPIKRTFKLGTCESGVRDAILRLLVREFPEEPFLEPFSSHLRKIGVEAFDPYSELEFVLEEFNVRLTFHTIRVREDVMTYTLPDCSLEPDERLVSNNRLKKMFGWF
jgi:hypothetical protein